MQKHHFDVCTGTNSLGPSVPQVADRWCIAPCVEACEDAILLRGPLDFPISAMFSLPAAVCPAAERIMKQSTVFLLKLFRDLPMVLNSPKDLECFIRLPVRALLALFHSENLNTDNEATVVVLLNIWLATNGNKCSSEERLALNIMVRFGFLSTSFVCTALPHMPSLLLTPEQSSEIFMLCSTRLQNGLSKSEWQASRRICPESWCVERGRMQTNQGHPFHIRFSTPAALLQKHVNGVAAMKASNGSRPPQIESRPVFAQGYAWKLALSSKSLDAAFAVDLHVWLPGGPPTAVVGVQCTVELTVYKEEGSRVVSAASKRVFSGSARIIRLLCGKQAAEGDPDMKQWQEMMQDKHLCIQAAILVL